MPCVVHVHSTFSDGGATVPEIAAAEARSGARVVLLTDHDTLAARRHGCERWCGPVLILVGHEVSPHGRHLLVFGARHLPLGQSDDLVIVGASSASRFSTSCTPNTSTSSCRMRSASVRCASGGLARISRAGYRPRTSAIALIGGAKK